VWRGGLLEMIQVQLMCVGAGPTLTLRTRHPPAGRDWAARRNGHMISVLIGGLSIIVFGTIFLLLGHRSICHGLNKAAQRIKALVLLKFVGGGNHARPSEHS
jgi:hypothetical protein